jgi:Ca-activated chloride channel family protein
MGACSGQSTMSYSNARNELEVLAKNVKPATLPVRLDPNEVFDLALSHEVQALPDISEYPFVVNPGTSSFITVYSTSPEIIQAANDFNAATIMVAGQQISVGLRAVPSDMGTNFILSNKYTPDMFIPKSELYGSMLSYRSVPIELIADTTVRGVSGVVVSDKTGVKSFSELVRKVRDGEMSVGYVDPLQDPDGLNFILSALYEFDNVQPIGEVAVQGLKQLQDHITYIANSSAQLKSSFLRGVLDGYVLDYGTFKSTADYRSGYTFIPFGIPQDNPVYTIGELTPIKAQIAQKFVEYCKAAGAGVTDSVVTGYKSTIELTSAVSGELIGIYKSVRGGSSNVTAVFVADVSGSMRGTPMLRLKTGLRGAISSINPNNNIGLVTFDSNVKIALPIAPFDGKQQSYFSNAISNMTDGSTTAMYDAIAVALQMMLEYQDQNPDTKLVLFVLTDGDSNKGLTFQRMKPIIAGLQIPVYTIGYESEMNGLNTGTLEQLAAINEAGFTNAGVDNITHILSSLLNSQT